MAATPATVTPPTTPESSRAGFAGRGLNILAFVVISLVLAIGAIQVYRSIYVTPDVTTKYYMEALIDGDSAAFVGLTCASQRAQAQSLVSNSTDTKPWQAALADKFLGGRPIEDFNNAVYDTEIVSADGKTATVVMNTRRNGGTTERLSRLQAAMDPDGRWRICPL